MQLRSPTTHYTFTDREGWDDGEKWELIDGRAFMMAPPMSAHQAIVGELFVQLSIFLKGHACRAFVAPFGVYLNSALNQNSNQKNDTVVEPDITVICDKTKISKRGCEGPPNLIIEVLSPTNRGHDRVTKFKLYLDYGVDEYWIVDNEEKIITVFVLENDKYVASFYDSNDSISSTCLSGCTINVAEIFAAADLDITPAGSAPAGTDDHQANDRLLKQQIAQKLIKREYPLAQIAEDVGLSLEEIEAL